MAVRPAEPGVSGGPHLVLADVGDDRGVVVGGLADLADHEVGRELAVAPGPRPVPGCLLGLDPPFRQLGEIGRAALRFHRGDERQQGRQNALHVAHDRDLNRDVLADLGRVDVHVDDPRVRGERRHVARDAVVEAHAQGDQQVGRLDGAVDVLPAVHADPAEAERVGLVHRAHAEKGVGDGDLRLLGKLPQFFGRVGYQDAVTGQDDGPLGAGDLLRGQPDLTVVALEVGLEAGQVDRGRVFGRAGAHQGVLRDVDVHGAGTAGGGDVECFGEDARDVVGVVDQVVVLGARQSDAGDVDLLERVLAQERRDHVAGDRNHGHGIQHGVADAGDEVRGAGAGRPEAHPNAA